MVLFESATTLHALLGDHLNTVRDLISTSGTLENHLVYNSYGELKTQTPGGYSPFHRFTGKPFDVAVGLQYNVNRWYDPATGRWISEDPIGFGGGHANLTRYVGNSPTNGIDRYGLQVGVQPNVKTFQSRIQVVQNKCFNCHQVVAGYVEFDDLSPAGQIAIMAYDHPPSPEYLGPEANTSEL